MSTDVDASRVGRRRYIALAALLVVALLGIIVINRTGVLGGDTPDGAGEPRGFQAQLSAKVVNVLEKMPAEDHGHAGHGTGPSNLVCGVRVFGTNPADADAIGEVAQVYAYHMCAVAEQGRQFILAVKLTGPAVITLAGDPPTVTVAEGGPAFRERVRALFPEKYQSEAFNENLTPEGMRDLIQRYEKTAKA